MKRNLSDEPNSVFNSNERISQSVDVLPLNIDNKQTKRIKY